VKLTARFKLILLSTMLFMYMTGVITWVMTNWFLIDAGFGLESSPVRIFWLQMHSIVSLFFLVATAQEAPEWRSNDIDYGLPKPNGSRTVLYHKRVIQKFRRTRPHLCGACSIGDFSTSLFHKANLK